MKSIRELLSGRAPLTVKGSASVLQAARLMHGEHVGCVVVVDEEHHPTGIFTERDLLARIVVTGRDPANVRVDEVMSDTPFLADAEEHVVSISFAMQSRHIRHLPVTESGRLIGVLSLRDLLATHLDEKHAEVQALTEYIQGEGEPAVS